LDDRLQPPAYRSFMEGGVVHSEEFWSGESDWVERVLTWARATMKVKQCLQPPIRAEEITLILEDDLALVKPSGDHVQIVQDLRLMLPPNHYFDGRLVLETDARAEQTGKPSYWRVAGLEIDRFRMVARGPGGGRPP